MSWTYSGDPATSARDEVRFLIQDTDQGVQLLSDEEIDYLLAQWLQRYDSTIFVASIAATAVGTKFTGIISVTADGVSVDVSQISPRYYEIAQRLREQYILAQSTGDDIDLTNIMLGAVQDWSILPLTFGVGMHDNLEAGQQDYAGTIAPYYDANGGLAEG